MEMAIVVLFLAAALQLVLFAALARQVGQLQGRLPPRGALVSHMGPEIGSAPEPVQLTRDDAKVTIGGPSGVRRLVLFIQPTCEACSRVAPAAYAVAAMHRDLEVVLASLNRDGALNDRFMAQANLRHKAVFDGSHLAAMWRITTTPHVVVMDAQGVVVAKGLVNNREQLEGLLRTRLEPVAGHAELTVHPEAEHA